MEAHRANARGASRRRLAGFLIRRAAALLATLLVASFVVFAGLHLAPGDPATFLIHSTQGVTDNTVAQVRAQYGLDRPLLTQYGDWLGGAVQLDFGRSMQFNEPIANLIRARLPTTVFLIAYATTIIVVMGLALGLVAALRGGAVDRGIVALTAMGAATPPFVAALLLISIFAVKLGWLPALGAGEGFLDQLRHLTLPAIALALSAVALLARITRAETLRAAVREHVTVAEGRGVPRAAVVRRHILRNALGPIVTVSGLLIAGLLVGTIVVETAFGIDGMGSLLLGAVSTKDFPLVQAVVLLNVTAFLVINTIVDLTYPLIDPRVTLDQESSAWQ
jgi:peptide/nickel transport system permease protein